MVKLNGPLFSMDARGKLADALVFSIWKGRNYARALVTPSNPQSGPQTGMRSMMKFLSQEWTNLDAAEKADWLTRAQQTVISNFNAYVSFNMLRWRSYLNPSKLTPATETGTAPDAPTTTPTGGIRHPANRPWPAPRPPSRTRTQPAPTAPPRFVPPRPAPRARVGP